MPPAELTKYAMAKYKQLYPSEKGTGQTTTLKFASVAIKRKYNEGQSGISKLARFNFNK